MRAKLKPLDQTNSKQTPDINNSQDESQPMTESNLFTHTTQNYRNPIKRCNHKCNNSKKMETNSFAYSTTKVTKPPITQPPMNQYYNCKFRNVVCLITCKYQNCGAQYVGYTMRQPERDSLNIEQPTKAQ